MIRLTLSAVAAIVALESVAAYAQPVPSASPDCHILSPIAARACYAAQRDAADKTEDDAATKRQRKADVAAARVSTAPPQNIALDLLHGGYTTPADKRYKTQLVSSPGNPIKENGAFVYTTPAFDADDRRTALYIQLFRIIGKASLPPSAVKQAKAQMKAMQKLDALLLARASGQPVPGKHGSTPDSGSATPAPASATGSATAAPVAAVGNTSDFSQLTIPQNPITFVLPPATSDANFVVQSLDGVGVMTAIPTDVTISTTFNSAAVDYNGKGECTNVHAQGSQSADDRTIIVDCFAHAVHNLRVQAAQDAIGEYKKWVHDPYRFTPPAGFTYEAPVRAPGGHDMSIASLYSTDAAAAPDVRMFGEADAVNAFLGGEDGRAIGNRLLAKLASSNAIDMPALRVAIGAPSPNDVLYKKLSDIASGTAAYDKLKSLLGSAPADASTDVAGGLAGAGIMSNETAYNALLPYAAKPKFVGGKWTEGLEDVAEDGAEEAPDFLSGVAADEAEAGPPGFVAAFVTTMIEAGVDEGEKVFGNKNLPSDLNDELSRAKAASDPSIADLAGSPSGRTELFTVFVGGTRHINW